MTRILHLIHTPRHSGAEMLVHDLCAYHGAQGETIAIASFAPPTDDYVTTLSDIRDTARLYFPPRATRKLARLAHYREAIRDFRPNTIFAHSVLPSIYGRLAMAASFVRAGFVTVLHASNNYTERGLRLSETLTKSMVDSVVSVSRQGAADYRNRFGGSPPVQVIPNGVDVEVFRPADFRRVRASTRRVLGVADSTLVLVHVGRVYDLKNQLLSVQLLQQLLYTRTAELWIAGLVEDQAYQQQLEDEVIARGLNGRVRFLGGRSDVPDLLAAADVFLIPSKTEAHSVAMLEALASGIPILASDIEVFQEYATMPAVQLVPLGDPERAKVALLDLAAHPRAFRKMSNFEISVTADAYRRLAALVAR